MSQKRLWCKACGKHDCPSILGEEADYDICEATIPGNKQCKDCGDFGETTGHMGCQYPQNH